MLTCEACFRVLPAQAMNVVFHRCIELLRRGALKDWFAHSAARKKFMDTIHIHDKLHFLSLFLFLMQAERRDEDATDVCCMAQALQMR